MKCQVPIYGRSTKDIHVIIANNLLIHGNLIMINQRKRTLKNCLVAFGRRKGTGYILLDTVYGLCNRKQSSHIKMGTRKGHPISFGQITMLMAKNTFCFGQNRMITLRPIVKNDVRLSFENEVILQSLNRHTHKFLPLPHFRQRI